MGLIYNGIEHEKPYINNIQHNAYLNGQLVWNNQSVLFTSDTEMTITPKHTRSGTLEYSLNNIAWMVIPSGSTTASSKEIYFRGMMPQNSLFTTNLASTNAWEITDGTNVKVIGNVNALLNYRDPPMVSREYCFASLFLGTSIVDASNLLLPATTVHTYGYRSMFDSCSLLVEGPKVVSATALGTYCFAAMFEFCTSLKHAPEFMATNIAVQRCFAYTFDGCTSLESIKVHYTVWPGNAGHSLPVQQEWLQDTASNGTFICPASLPDIRGTTFIPDTWTKVDL